MYVVAEDMKPELDGGRWLAVEIPEGTSWKQ